MLHLIARLLPAPLHRLGLRLVHAIRIGWWQVRRPLVIGCQIVAVNPQGEVLLVRHSYGSPRWMLPGGGLARGETPIAAAIRELAEETACTLLRPVVVAVTRRRWHGTVNLQHVIVGTGSNTPRPDGREILDARWFAVGALPADASPNLAAKLNEWLRLFGASEQG
jgi:8-oxo-dGTP pyrophosphatase MutT (NUDIX family)